MKLPPEGARWLVSLRFGACAGVFLVTTAAWLLGVLPQPLPLVCRGRRGAGVQPALQVQPRTTGRSPRRASSGTSSCRSSSTLWPWRCSCTSPACRGNPFLSFFVFHMIIAGMYLRGNLPYLIAAAATCLVGAIMLLEYLGWIPRFDLNFSAGPAGPGAVFPDRVCRPGQHLVDRGLFHHGHPPLRGPGARGTPPEGEASGHRPVGGRDRPRDRQSLGRRAELPAADRRDRPSTIRT